MELHPRLAVVHAPESARRALVDALTAALRGDHGTAGFVEVHGIILDLDRETLRLLDLDGNVEMVLGADDLPAEAVGLAGRQRRTADDAALKQRELVDARHRQVDAAAEVVAAVEVAMRSASEAHDDVAARLTETERALEDAVASREAAERAVESASDAIVEVEGSTKEDGADEAFADELAVFDDVDDLYEDDTPVPDSPDLASELVEDAGYEAACHADEASAKAALDAVHAAETTVLEARDEVERAARAANPARLDAAERAELDAAHEAVLNAEDRAERRLAGTAARRKLDEAKSFERAVLDRLGLDSYSDFLLRSSMGSTDPSAELRLEIARTDLLRAESELSEARALAAATPAPARPAPVRQAAPQPVSNVRQPPQPTPAAVRRRERSEAADARLVAASRARDDALAAESVARAAYERAAADAVDSEGKLAELAARHDEAEQRLAQARLRADADEHAPSSGAADEPAGDPTPQVDGDGRGAALDELDRHLLGWLAARGQHPLADPLPIVLDDVYRHVSEGDLDPLLVRLDHLADSLHVVYLTDDPQVVRWTAALSPERGGLSTISDAGSATSE